MRVWATVERALSSHAACALVTVVEVRGSAPREPGARMVVMPDGGFLGTIGGGALEWRAIAQAREGLARRGPLARLSRHALGPELGQCCGGSVRLLTEVFESDRAEEVRGLADAERDGPFETRAELGGDRVHRERARPAGAGRRRRSASRNDAWRSDSESGAAASRSSGPGMSAVP